MNQRSVRAAYSYYFDVPSDGHLRLVKQFGNYQLFARDR